MTDSRGGHVLGGARMVALLLHTGGRPEPADQELVAELVAEPRPAGFWLQIAASLLARVDDAERRAALRARYESEIIGVRAAGCSRQDAQRLALPFLAGWVAGEIETNRGKEETVR